VITVAEAWSGSGKARCRCSNRFATAASGDKRPINLNNSLPCLERANASEWVAARQPFQGAPRILRPLGSRLNGPERLRRLRSACCSARRLIGPAEALLACLRGEGKGFPRTFATQRLETCLPLERQLAGGPSLTQRRSRPAGGSGLELNNDCGRESLQIPPQESLRTLVSGRQAAMAKPFAPAHLMRPPSQRFRARFHSKPCRPNCRSALLTRC